MILTRKRNQHLKLSISHILVLCFNKNLLLCNDLKKVKKTDFTGQEKSGILQNELSASAN